MNARPLNRLHLEALVRIDDPSFEAVYSIYSELFPLEDEREPPEAFGAILKLNADINAQAKFGPYREIVTAIRLWAGGPVVGGHVFGVMTSPAHYAAGYPASIQAIYTFLHPSARGRISMGDITKYSREIAYETFCLERDKFTRSPLMVFEVNNPLKMTEVEIESDTFSSGLHPARRYAFWIGNGFAPLSFDYVQPRLREDAEPVRFLDLFCSGRANGVVPGPVLREHLQAFISLSVLKGKGAEQNDELQLMLEQLSDTNEVSFVARDDPEQIRIMELARKAASLARTHRNREAL